MSHSQPNVQQPPDDLRPPGAPTDGLEELSMLDNASIPEASRSAGLERIERFLPSAGPDYARRRNFDFGPGNRGNVSMLSPYVRHRLVLESEILRATLARHSRSAADKFVQEVFWRAYFKGWLEHHPDVWQNYRKDLDALVERLDTDNELSARYGTATTAQTGIDCFDTWVRELVGLGYLHNHARMWFASIWVFTLGLPWQLGADFFLRHLMDGDPASNTLGWRWVSGLHTKGKTYLARVSNITSYTDDRFNPLGQLAVNAPPLDEPHEVVTREPRPAEAFDFERPWLLLVTEDDCCMELADYPRPPEAVFGLTAVTRRSPLAVGQVASAFAADAVVDAVERAAALFDCPGERVESPEWAPLIAATAEACGVDTVVAPFAPVGPTADALAEAIAPLREQGIRIAEQRRGYDERAWPHAGRGFFRLKKHIPELLDAIEAD